MKWTYILILAALLFVSHWLNLQWLKYIVLTVCFIAGTTLYCLMIKNDWGFHDRGDEDADST